MKAIKEIKTIQDIKEICEFLSDAGLGYFHDWDMKNRLLEKIIREANTLRVEYRQDELTKLFDGDFVKFKKIIVKHFAGFDESDKLDELAGTIYPKLKEDGKYDWKNKTRCRKSNYIILKANYNGYKVNEILKLLGYAGDEIGYWSDYQKIPKSTERVNEDGTKSIVLGNTGTVHGKNSTKIFWEVYANGNAKLTGDIREINNLYTKLWGKLAKRSEEKQEGVNYIIDDGNGTVAK